LGREVFQARVRALGCLIEEELDKEELEEYLFGVTLDGFEST
jgi:hypothetical protein